MEADQGDDKSEAASDMILEPIEEGDKDQVKDLDSNPDILPIEDGNLMSLEDKAKSITSRKSQLIGGSDVRSLTHASHACSRSTRS